MRSKVVHLNVTLSENNKEKSNLNKRKKYQEVLFNMKRKQGKRKEANGP